MLVLGLKNEEMKRLMKGKKKNEKEIKGETGTGRERMKERDEDLVSGREGGRENEEGKERNKARN